MALCIGLFAIRLAPLRRRGDHTGIPTAAAQVAVPRGGASHLLARATQPTRSLSVGRHLYVELTKKTRVLRVMSLKHCYQLVQSRSRQWS
jgi:hypothetical protein